jgi:hypothetical protein
LFGSSIPGRCDLIGRKQIVRKEYVVVPDKLLENTRELKPYFKAQANYEKKEMTIKKAPIRKKNRSRLLKPGFCR